MFISWINFEYHNVPKVSDRHAWANSVDPEEQSDQGLHYLLFRLHPLDQFFCSKTILF